LTSLDSTTARSLPDLLRSRRVVVCAGAGGVGKTSVAAALGVAAARLGRRVVVLTVDPALRLAQTLGVSRDTDARQPLEGERAAQLGVASGDLSVMMLDAERTWHRLIERTTLDEGTRARVLSHPLYRMLGRYLAGAQEYMAMEKLLSVLDEAGSDLVVLDTPPSRHALDFLRAPERLIAAIDGPVIRALSDSGRKSGPSVRWLSRGVALMVRTLGRFMGATLLEDLAEILSLLDRSLGGFRERAERVAAAFRDGTFAYVLVSRPQPSRVNDVLHFEAELARQGLAGDALVLNCSVDARHPSASGDRSLGIAALRQSSGLPEELVNAVLRAVDEHDAAVRAERASSQVLLEASSTAARELLRLPAFPSGVVGASELVELATRMSERSTLRASSRQ
jgi:anion-transporting  ArsA/GET3 family ATPase